MPNEVLMVPGVFHYDPPGDSRLGSGRRLVVAYDGTARKVSFLDLGRLKRIRVDASELLFCTPSTSSPRKLAASIVRKSRLYRLHHISYASHITKRVVAILRDLADERRAA